MSYTKLEIRYIGDGVNSKTDGETRDAIKKRTLALAKKVQEYGDEHGYDKIELLFNGDRITLKGGAEVLQDQDINGTNSNEYIVSIEGYEWLN